MQILTRFNKVIAHNESGYTPVGNAAICNTSKKCYGDALITTVDCVPTDIDQYEYYYIDGRFIKGAEVIQIPEIPEIPEIPQDILCKPKTFKYDKVVDEDLTYDLTLELWDYNCLKIMGSIDIKTGITQDTIGDWYCSTNFTLNMGTLVEQLIAMSKLDGVKAISATIATPDLGVWVGAIDFDVTTGVFNWQLCATYALQPQKINLRFLMEVRTK